MTEAPKVYCPKEGKRVPVWYCIGSFTQKRERCPDWEGTAEISYPYAKVKCNFKGEKQ